MSADIASKSVQKTYDYLAPDGSQIRLLVNGANGGLCHCTLPAGHASAAVRHASVEEIWFILSGTGEVWRDGLGAHALVPVAAGHSLVIPPGVAFQFRNTGTDDLCFVITTMPLWPGPQEAQPSAGHWS